MSDITKKIDGYLKEDINESMLAPNEMSIKDSEYTNLSTGLKRIEYRFSKANTPQKYVDAFSVVSELISRFPLKSKVIWQAVASSYNARFGTASGVIDAGE